MHHQPISLLPLLIVTFLALVVPFAVHKIKFIKVPIAVGELLCGIALGKSGLGIIKPDHTLEFLSLLGFTYLMFLGGMEIDFAALKSTGKEAGESRFSFFSKPLFISLSVLIATLGLGYFAVYYLKASHHLPGNTNVLMLTLLISTTSVGVVLPSIKESGIIDSKYGQSVLLSSVLLDFATIVLATLTLVLLRGSKNGAVQLAELVCLVIVFILAFYFSRKVTSKPGIKRIYDELSNTSAQIRVRTAFAIMVLFAYLSQAVGVELILGAFLAGVLFSLFFRSESLESAAKFDAIGFGFLIPVFFIMIGAEMNLDQIIQNPAAMGISLVLLLVAFCIKIIPMLPFATVFGLRNSVAGGFLISGQLSLTIAFAEVAVAEKLLDPTMQIPALLIAVSTCIISPLMFSKLYKTTNLSNDGQK